MIELYPCKGCGGESFEVEVKKYHDLLIDEEEPGKAYTAGGGDSVGDITCSACGRLAATPEQLTEVEIDYLLDGKEVEA